MAIAIRATASGGADEDTYSVTIPTHAVGDLLIVLIAIDDAVTIDTAPSGWTQLFLASQGSGTTAVGFLGYARIATATNHTFQVIIDGTSEPATWHTWSISGHGVTNITTQLIPNIQFNTGTGTSHGFTAVTGLDAGLKHLVLLFDGSARGDSNYEPTAAPSGYSGFRNTNNGTGTGGVRATSSSRILAAGVTTTGSASANAATSARWLSCTIAIPELLVVSDVLMIQVGDVLLAADKLYAGDDKINRVYAGDILIYEDA